MYHINGQSRGFEALPGKDNVNHNYHPHSYSLPCGDVYVVTAGGNIVFVDRDSEEKVCVWNSMEKGLWPCYYKPVTGHIGSSEVFNTGITTFIPIYCVEEWKESHPLACPSAITEDMLCIMLNTYDQVNSGSNWCAIFRRGVVIYNGRCDFKGVPYIETRGNSKRGNWYRAEGEQVYQWAKDEKGKYLGEGVDRSKTWEWVNVFNNSINANIANDYACAEYAVNDTKDGSVISAQWYEGCLDCGSNDTCNDVSLDPDTGEFVKHTIGNIWFSDCGIPEGAQGCGCVNHKATGIEYIKQTGWQWGAQICDLGGGYALVPICNQYKRSKEYTWLGSINGVNELPGFTGEVDENNPTPDKVGNLDKTALDNYKLYLTDNPAPEHNGTNPVIRTGIQVNDCFTIGEDFYRFEWNKWVKHSDWENTKYRPAQLMLITPAMTGENSAMEGCDPSILIKGASVSRCGTDYLAAHWTEIDGTQKYSLISIKGGTILEGNGNPRISCLACWVMLSEGDSHTLYNSNLEAIYGYTGGTDLNMGYHYPTYEEDNPDDQLHYYLTVTKSDSTGVYKTVICCDEVVGTWKVSNSRWGLVDGVQISVNHQRYYGLYDVSANEAVVIENCAVVWRGCGRLSNIWGVANALIFTCRCINVSYSIMATPGTPINSPTCGEGTYLYRGYSYSVQKYYQWIDLISGTTGEYAGTDSGSSYWGNVYDGTDAGTYTAGEITNMINDFISNLSTDADTPPTSSAFVSDSVTVTIDSNSQGQRQELVFHAFYTKIAPQGPWEYDAKGKCIVMLRNRSTQVLTPHDSFDVPSQGKVTRGDVRGSRGWSENGYRTGVGIYGTQKQSIGQWGLTDTCNSSNQWGTINYISSCTTYAQQVDATNAAVLTFGGVSSSSATTWANGYLKCFGEKYADYCYSAININSNGYSNTVWTSCASCEGKIVSSQRSDIPVDPGCENVPISYDTNPCANNTSPWYDMYEDLIYQAANPRIVTVKKDGKILLDRADGLGWNVYSYPSFPGYDYKRTPSSECYATTLDFTSHAAPANSCSNNANCCINYCLARQGLGQNTVNWMSSNAILPYQSNSYSILTCCTGREMLNYRTGQTTSGDKGYDAAFISDGNGTIYLLVDSAVVGTFNYTGDVSQVSAALSCTCGFIYARLGDNGQADNLLAANYYDQGLSSIQTVLGIDCGGMIDIICCNGYGLARCIAVPTPVILQDGYASSAPTVTPENYQDLLNDPASTICELDDGTKAIGIHSKITTYDCDGSNPQDWWYVHEWAFVGSDNKVRTVTNTYGGNPAAMVNGASEWVPFKWTNPERQAIVYEYIDGEIGPIIVRDRDITGQRCNFYIEDTGVYEGTDVSVENGDMDAGFEFQYTYPLDQQAICDAGIMQDQCTIYKTINNYKLIDTGTVNNRNPFMRYEIEQGLDIDVKISQKGILTNSKYTGKYEILNSRVRTGTFSDIDKLEQGTRKDTKYGGEGQYPLIVNDREAVAKFDRIRGNSNNYYSNVDVIQDLKLYYEDQTRSVWSENGIVHILDKDLGMIEVDMWGQ